MHNLNLIDLHLLLKCWREGERNEFEEPEPRDNTLVYYNILLSPSYFNHVIIFRRASSIRSADPDSSGS